LFLKDSARGPIAQESFQDCTHLLKEDVALNPHTPTLGVPSVFVWVTQTQLSWLRLAPQVLKCEILCCLQGTRVRMLERIRRKTERSSPENRGETRPSNGFRYNWENLDNKPEAPSTQLLPCSLCVPTARYFQKAACNIGSTSSCLCIRTGSHQTITHKPLV